MNLGQPLTTAQLLIRSFAEGMHPEGAGRYKAPHAPRSTPQRFHKNITTATVKNEAGEDEEARLSRGDRKYLARGRVIVRVQDEHRNPDLIDAKFLSAHARRERQARELAKAAANDAAPKARKARAKKAA